MKKRIIKYFLFATLISLFASCEKEYEEIGRLTFFPDFTMTGEELIFHNQGEPFTDPGVKAGENGAEIPVNVVVSGSFFGYSGTTVDANSADQYVINYSATNSDGFPGSVQRTVYVLRTGDMVSSIEGLYTADVVRNGAVSPQYQGLSYIIITKTGDNTYKISDGIGGYYAIGRNYGNDYIASGCEITATDIPGNIFSFTEFSVNTFGGVCTMSGMTVDPVAKTIYIETEWDSGYLFAVTLTQVEY